jgi:phosphopantothenoylcysteine decarboxylase/phosphopantothenate--cysteine ligase
MGFALAAAAAALGAETVLVAGPVHLDTPPDMRRIDVRSAADMHSAVLSELPADLYVGAAAVADWTPRAFAAHKLKKRPGIDTLALELVRTADILADVAAHPLRPRCVVGFAAETGDDADIARYARDKLERKRVDFVCANRVGVAGSGFESEDNALHVFWNGGERRFGPAPKTRLAAELLDFIAARMPA